MVSKHLIFVQIPSYRDSQLIPTLLDLSAQAMAPATIRVVVCWQHGLDESVEMFQAAGFSLVSTESVHGRTVHSFASGGIALELIDVPHSAAEGCGWARSIAQGLYRGEKYNLQIDAHHRFARHWDNEMVCMLEELRAHSSKPLLTGHPPAFWPETYPEGRQQQAAIMVADEFTADGIIRFRSTLLPTGHPRRRPWRARFMSGGFVFSDGTFISEVPQDPHHFFSTEEVVMTVRAYTHGFDMYHPHRPLLWHYYGAESPKVWEDQATGSDNGEESDVCSFDDRAAASAERAMSLLGLLDRSHQCLLGPFGLGFQRTLRDYERLAGLSFSKRGIHRSALERAEPDETLKTISDDDWEAGLICRRSIRVSLSFRPAEQTELYSVQIYMESQGGDALLVRRLSDPELESLVSTSSLEFLYEHCSGPHQLPTAFLAEAVTSRPDSQRFLSVDAQEEQAKACVH